MLPASITLPSLVAMAGVNVVGDLEPVSPRPMLEPLEHVNHHPSNVDLGEDGAFKEDNPTSGYNTEKSKGGSTNTFSVGHIEVPDGGHRAWLVVLGGFINFTIGFGMDAARRRRTVIANVAR